MQVVVDGLLTQYTLSGKGQLVVLLHGWGDNSATFDHLQQVLSKKYEVLALDLPGFGATQAPDSVWDLDDYARFIKSAMGKLNLSNIYALAGHSNGGAIAIRSISMGLVKPERLILLAAAGIRDKTSGRRVALKVVAKTGNVATIWLPGSTRQRLRKKLYGVAGSDEGVAPQLKETFRKVVRQDVQADAAKVVVPTLLIYAADDQPVPVADGQRFRELIKGSRLEIISKAGHFVHHDQPERVEQLIEDFLT